MNEQEFELFLSNAVEELKTKQESLTQTYGLGTHKRWMFENDKAKLQFFNQDNQRVLEADIIDIGSFSPATNTWKWAWAYDNINPEMKQESMRLKELADITDMTTFEDTEPFEADEYLAWELSAMAVKHLNALGCYRAFSSFRNVNMFFALTALHNIEPEAAQ